ncbi:hypothetical protein WMY93_032295 [Mugilogobius chulae]|uniref:SPRY domain-containing protein n=1 Tax=Mugilogobius chulae TaxID=88201 RepID=A0AAW0MJZ6_9GOBI
MFVWKEMVQMVKPREERLTLETDKPACVCRRTRALPRSSTETFSRQHYWEVYVGDQSEWELGLPQTYLTHRSGTYQICEPEYYSEHDTVLQVQVKPQKIGIYLNCPRKELSFYNADTMELIHTVKLYFTSFPVSAHFKLGNTKHEPLLVCHY